MDELRINLSTRGEEFLVTVRNEGETTSYEELGANTTAGLTLEDCLPYIMMLLAVVEYVLISMMVLGNAFILAAYISSRIRAGAGRGRLSPAGRLVLNLSFADLLVGLGMSYFSLFKFWPDLAARLAHHRIPCVLRFSVCFLSMFGSHCALLVIALDRYTAIVHTLHYKEYFTTRVSWCLIGAGWCVPLLGSGAIFYVNEWRPDIPYCDEHYVVPSFLLSFALPSNVIVLIIVVCIHWRVHSEVQAYDERCANADFVASAAYRYRHGGRGSRKSARVLLQVTGSFIFCWTPLDIMLVTLVFEGPAPVVVVLFESAFALAMTSFLINPFTYAWKTEAIRKPLAVFLARFGAMRTGEAPEGLRGQTVFATGCRQPSQSVNLSSSVSGSASSTGTSNTECPQ